MKFRKQVVHLDDVLTYYGIEYEIWGSRGKALCPFHDDKSPSMVVYLDQEEPTWYCFVCAEGTTATNFVYKMENDDIEAQRICGILRGREVTIDPKVYEKRKHKEKYLEANTILSPMYRDLGKTKPSLYGEIDKQLIILDQDIDLPYEQILSKHLEWIKDRV